MKIGRVLFEDHDHLVLVLERVVQVQQLRMVQLVHDSDLVPDRLLRGGVRSVDELRHERPARRPFHRSVNNSKRSAVVANKNKNKA